MKPDGVIQARGLKLRIHPRNAVGEHAGIEQIHVRGVGQQALVKGEIIWDRPRCPDPDTHVRRSRLGLDRIDGVDYVLLKRLFALVPVFELFRGPGERLVSQDLGVGQFFGRWDARHRQPVFESRFFHLKRHRHAENRLAVLDRDDATRGETLAVANPIHFVEDWRFGIARPQKVALE